MIAAVYRNPANGQVVASTWGPWRHQVLLGHGQPLLDQDTWRLECPCGRSWAVWRARRA